MSQTQDKEGATLDPQEVNRFSAMAAEWWDPKGKFRPLHDIGPPRLGFFRSEICRHFFKDEADPAALTSLRLLDIGCGGGLVAEPMARQGASVTAIDPAENNIKCARLHARQQGLEIDYRACRAEDVVSKGEIFDVVLCLEVVEHVPDVPAFIKEIAKLVAPGGLLILSTINRTMKSFALAIVGAEYVLQWLPKGTHQWDRFIKVEELKDCLDQAGLKPQATAGLEFSPLKGNWLITSDTSVNYFLTAGRSET